MSCFFIFSTWQDIANKFIWPLRMNDCRSLHSLTLLQHAEMSGNRNANINIKDDRYLCFAASCRQRFCQRLHVFRFYGDYENQSRKPQLFWFDCKQNNVHYRIPLRRLHGPCNAFPTLTAKYGSRRSGALGTALITYSGLCNLRNPVAIDRPGLYNRTKISFLFEKEVKRNRKVNNKGMNITTPIPKDCTYKAFLASDGSKNDWIPVCSIPNPIFQIFYFQQNKKRNDEKITSQRYSVFF